jgi:hypothetical protein
LIIVINEDFLERDFGDKKYDLILMNPPWTKLGTKFIDKAISLLVEGGKLVCIIGIQQLQATSLKNRFNPGTFYDLNQRGHFEYIHTYNKKYSLFSKNNQPPNLWFVWSKEPKNNRETIIINREQNKFDYKLTGKEALIPQGNFDWVDYDNGITLEISDVSKEVSFKTSTTKGFSFLEKGRKGKCMNVPDKYSKSVDKDKLKYLFDDLVHETYLLHYAQIATAMILPPIKKSLILKN